MKHLSDTDQAPYSAPVNTGGAAFPRPCGETSQGGNYEQDGMTLRDYFAGHALIGMMRTMMPYSNDYERNACDAYKQADAMLAAREVRK